MISSICIKLHNVIWLCVSVCAIFPVIGLAVRNPAKGRGPQDCITVFTGKPSGDAEFLAAARSRKRSNIPGRKRKELECSFCYGPHTSYKHTPQPANTSKLFLSFPPFLCVWKHWWCVKKKLMLQNILSRYYNEGRNSSYIL